MSIPEEILEEASTPDRLEAAENLDKVLSLAEAAEIVGLSAHTLAQQAAKGHLRARKIGHTWVTTTNWLEEYVAIHARRQNRAS